MNSTAAYKEAMASAPDGVVHLMTFEFHHANFVDEFLAPKPLRIVVNNEAINATLEATAPVDPGASVTFENIPVRYIKPEVGPTGNPFVAIEFDNVDAKVEKDVALASKTTSPIVVYIREYLSTVLTAPQTDPLKMTLKQINANEAVITGQLHVIDAANTPFPSRTFTREKFPALIR